METARLVLMAWAAGVLLGTVAGIIGMLAKHVGGGEK